MSLGSENIFPGRSPGQARELYASIDREADAAAGGDAGFSMLLGSRAPKLDAAALAGYAERYAVIRRFQQRALELFSASLRGDADPELAAMILGDAPPHLGAAYHRSLSPAQMQFPVFFRTDEPAPGAIAEVQCPGSGWSIHDQLHSLYAEHGVLRGGTAGRTLARQFANDLRRLLGADPALHHLADNASQPEGARYFIQKTRECGLRYFGWDRGMHWRDCNFVRSHDWTSLANDNFHNQRLAACAEGRLRYDLSPCALFDSKLLFALPFDARWRAHFDDGIRAILPYTVVVNESGMTWRNGERITIERICSDSTLREDMYTKYAGTDQAFNWGSRAVYHLGAQRPNACRESFRRILADGARGRHWILQQARREACPMSYYTRDGELREESGYLKLSAFYGPGGLYGVLAYALRFTKVHGTPRTVACLVL